MSISGMNIDGMPKPKYSKSDMVLNSVIQLQEDEELKRAVKEVKAVQMALQLVDEDCKNIFEKIYTQSKSKWELINNGMSERTYFRKKTELITQVNKELKKYSEKLSTRKQIIVANKADIMQDKTLYDELKEMAQKQNIEIYKGIK